MFKSKKGLTIVELLAVIIIIAIIGAIASTVLFNILDAVEEELLLLKMNSLEESALLYIADEKLYISSDGSSVLTVQDLIDKEYVTETDTCTDSSGSEYKCLVNNVTNNSMNEDVILINFNDYNYTATYVSADSLAG